MMSIYKQRSRGFTFFFTSKWVLSIFLMTYSYFEDSETHSLEILEGFYMGCYKKYKKLLQSLRKTSAHHGESTALQNVSQSRFISSCPTQGCVRIKPSQAGFECLCWPRTDLTPSSSGGHLNLTQSWNDRKYYWVETFRGNFAQTQSRAHLKDRFAHSSDGYSTAPLSNLSLGSESHLVLRITLLPKNLLTDVSMDNTVVEAKLLYLHQ